MTVTTGNFQDLVQLSNDTLYHLGPMFEVGNSAASTVTFGFSNSGGLLNLVASHTTNATVGMPTGGTLLTNINVSAGTTSGNVSAVTFSNSNNVTFGFDGSNVTASFNADAQAIGGISAGAQLATSGTIVFSNSNGVTFGMAGSTRITATVAASIVLSAGTTSNSLNQVTFSNSNGVSFGLNASTITASVATSLTNINISAGTTSSNVSAVTFSNGSNVSFGFDGTNITASVATSLTNIRVSAGTTSNLLSSVVFSNSNGISFGLNGSTITAQNGGISSWSNGRFATAQSGGQNTLFFQPILVQNAITVTNLLWLASVSSQASNSSGGLSVSAALYTLSGGTKITLVSSGSTNLTWTSGAALSSNTGINYQQMSVASWNLTPGPYLFAWWISTQNGIGMSFYGDVQQPAISSGQQANLTNLMVEGYSQATTNALPTSFALSNTASYIRTGATAAQQPVFYMQGT